MKVRTFSVKADIIYNKGNMAFVLRHRPHRLCFFIATGLFMYYQWWHVHYLSVPTGYPMDTTIIAHYVKANFSYMNRLLTFQISTNTT